MFRRLALMTACVAMLAGCTAELSGPAATESSTPEKPSFDVSDLSALQEVWWTWAASATKERNPVADITGKYCADNQPEGVWLVAGSFGLPVVRRCTVPAGLPLAGPAVNFLSGTADDCDGFMADAMGEVTLDGEPVPLKAEDFDAVSFSTVEGNAFTGSGGGFVGYGCGLWFSVPPLDAGEHVLEILGSSGDVVVAAKYELTVAAQ